MQHGKYFISYSNSFHNSRFEEKASFQEGWHARIPYPKILVLVLVSLIKLSAYIVNRNIVIVRVGLDFALLLRLGLVYYKQVEVCGERHLEYYLSLLEL